MKLLLANPRGFCAGVERAIRVVEEALTRFGRPVYVRHGIVHNRQVIERLEEMGAIFVENPSDAPKGSVMIFSAHGVSPAVRTEAEAEEQKVIDATCPLVVKVHQEARRYAQNGFEVLLVGHANHVEVEGTRGEAPHQTHVVESISDVEQLVVQDPSKLGAVTQTTLSVDDTSDVLDALRDRFPLISTPRKQDICYATQNRQDAVKRMAAQADRILVISSPESSNGMRLVETARRAGADVRRVEDETELERSWLMDAQCVGVTAGAAVPASVIAAVTSRISTFFGDDFEIEELPGEVETMHFPLPAAIRGA
jgi:4-hydroxy-3-methylbut-2-en-1-yl diphosphate reductase